MTRAIYIIGGSGSGKSTLMAELLDGWVAGPYERWTPKEMFGHYIEHPEKGRGAYLGRLRPEYPGTDALCLSVSPHATRWLEALPLLGLDWVFGEGERLGHPKFLAALHAKADLAVVHLEVDPEVASQRRIARGGKLVAESFGAATISRAKNSAAACKKAGIFVTSSVPVGSGVPSDIRP
jgi:GTPase SAR1 family protein